MDLSTLFLPPPLDESGTAGWTNLRTPDCSDSITYVCTYIHMTNTCKCIHTHAHTHVHTHTHVGAKELQTLHKILHTPRLEESLKLSFHTAADTILHRMLQVCQLIHILCSGVGAVYQQRMHAHTAHTRPFGGQPTSSSSWCGMPSRHPTCRTTVGGRWTTRTKQKWEGLSALGRNLTKVWCSTMMKELQLLRKSITLVKAKRLDSAPNRPVVADGWSTCIGRYVSGERMRFSLWLCIHFFLKVQEMTGTVGYGGAEWAGSTTPFGELRVVGWYSYILHVCR